MQSKSRCAVADGTPLMCLLRRGVPSERDKGAPGLASFRGASFEMG